MIRPVHPLLLPALLLLAACSGTEGGGAEGPEASFETVEERLLEASTSHVAFTITASGVTEVELEGSLAVGREGRARLEADGTFGGEEVSLLLVSDGQRMRLTNGTDTVESATPPELKEALVVGLTRMGVLHNLARLTGVAPPDHADGDVDGWVEVEEFRTGESGSIAFDIRVARQPVGMAQLSLSPGTELPAERRQTVQFETGQMEVTERYGAVSVGAGFEPGSFELD